MSNPKNVQQISPVTVICFGESITFTTRKEAFDFYSDCAVMCEGSDQERYIVVLNRLKYTDDSIIYDNY